MTEKTINDELIKQAQTGNEEAMDLIIREYKGLVLASIKNYFLIGAEQEDLFQEGVIGLLKAIKNYDEQKATFKTFATCCIKSQIFTAIRNSTTLKHSILNEATSNLESEQGQKKYSNESRINANCNPEEIFLGKEKLHNFGKFIKVKFSQFEKIVFSYMIQGFSYKEIAIKLDKTPKVIDNTFQRIKKKSELWLKTY